ncbi:Phosphoserine phosphatase RsbU [Fundidesulfovibrio magnetotacticus]|uniref:Phosphoserine phosphatase RsbU n=1 Tax=Fundidesulfovibrio magnetotacticus TaxID=2730080 RepID=A0A6V8LTX9_9BACT|nr:GAF domain-containing SpoIIE family protein phosphatase [Fundidesulfovibrio magnetotacticus]GFK95873.1 Phosphoserine phosphatase RsbU [Fundidesulfovibrio magnetotacticus]
MPPDQDAQDPALLARRMENLRRCFELCALISSSIDLDDVLDRIMTASRQASDAETCSLLLTDEATGDLVFTVAQGPVASMLPKGHVLRRGEGIAGWVQVNRTPVLVPDAYADPRFNREVDRRTGYRTNTILCVPLTARNRTIGVAALMNKTTGGPFTEEDLDLFTIIAAQAAIAIENARLHQAMLAKQRMEFELEIAASIQQDFLPHAPPRAPGVEVAGATIPCDSTGGDYFDYLPHPDPDAKGFSVAVGDVTGHGIGAALLMASARALIRSGAAQSGAMDEKLSRVNRLMCADTGSTGRFMTLYWLALDTQRGLIRYVKAGHDPAIVYSPASASFSELDGKGIPLGVEPCWGYEEGRRAGWQAGELLVMATDGVWECRNAQGEMFGKERLRAVMAAHSSLHARDVLQAVLDAVEAFRGKTPRHDDLTLVVVKFLKDAPHQTIL